MMNVLQTILFPPPPSIIVNTMSFISFASLGNAGFLELKGKHMQYSKFSTSNQQTNTNYNIIKFSSKTGMTIIYSPAFLFGIASFLIFPHEGLRFLLLRLALTIHFLKRVLETLLVHKYGKSEIPVDTTVAISLSYFLSTVMMIYAQHLSRELAEPSMDLKYVGVGLFVVGIAGNFYHHYILSTLRKEGEKEYKIPKGGLFQFVICPHYLFEVLGFVGVSCIAQTFYALAFTGGSALYLMGRSYATKKWYLSKFEDFPKDVKAFLPFLF